MATALGFAIPMTALAGGTAHCGSYGRLYTMGTASGTEHYHWVEGFGSTDNVGTGYHQQVWGYLSGSFDWDVYGSGISGESGACVQ